MQYTTPLIFFLASTSFRIKSVFILLNKKENEETKNPGKGCNETKFTMGQLFSKEPSRAVKSEEKFKAEQAEAKARAEAEAKAQAEAESKSLEEAEANVSKVAKANAEAVEQAEAASKAL